MKLKEIPVSFYYSFKLNLISLKKLTESSKMEVPVIVSLTTIPSRLSKVHITIRSILTQNPCPKRVVIWINQEHKSKIPKTLIKLEGERFEIRFTHLHSSHKKLIHSLQKYSDLPIITCDDDCIYRQSWLKSLYDTHLQFPDHIIAHRIRCIRKNSTGNYLPYKEWVCTEKENSKAQLAIGAEGVLYPPNIFDDTIFNEELFLQLAPTADDLWFKAMALKQGINYKKAAMAPKESIPIMNTQKISLKKVNIDLDRNRSQWEELVRYFNLE